MKKYKGLSLERAGKSWEALRAIYPNKKAKEIEELAVKRLELFGAKLGVEFDEDVYMASLPEVAEYLDVEYPFLLLNMFRRWSRPMEKALAGLVVIGTGECQNCGVDDLEFHDSGEFWQTRDVYKCRHCGELQHKRGD